MRFRIGAVPHLLAAIGAGTFFSPAHAQSSVSIYGIIDTSVEVSNVGAGTVKRMISGGHLGSRWGLRGSEDLGGGQRANFVLEQHVNTDDGITGPGFGRQSWVGLSGHWGEFRVGLQNSPVFINVNGYLDAFAAATIASALGSFQTLVPRAPDAISYHPPAIGGLKSQFMIGWSDAATKNRVQSHHVGVEYDQGPFSAAVGYQRVHSADWTNLLKVATAGASYAFGPLRVYGGLNHAKRSDGVIDKTAYVLSAAYTLPNSPSMLSLGVGHVDDRSAASNDADQVGLMYSYFLSKRTTLYFSAAKLKNRNSATFTMNGATVAGIPVAYPGADPRGLQFGIQHRF